MMMNLFSMFDPSTSNFFSLNWLTVMLSLFFYSQNYWVLTTRIHLMKNTMMTSIISDLNTNLASSKTNNIIILMIIFTMIYSTNLLSIIPFIFANNSQMSMTLYLSLPLWLSFMVMGWYKTPFMMLAHLVPLGTPLLLCPFMILIETISNLIRPLTLAIRLSANMIAGHILISLSSILLFSLMTVIPSTIILQILTLLEMSVSMIQGYVFIMLLSLYLNEINL